MTPRFVSSLDSLLSESGAGGKAWVRLGAAFSLLFVAAFVTDAGVQMQSYAPPHNTRSSKMFNFLFVMHRARGKNGPGHRHWRV